MEGFVHSVYDIQSSNCYQTIKNKDRSSKVKIVYNQILQSLQIFPRETAWQEKWYLFSSLEFYRPQQIRNREYSISLEVDWLPYDHNQTSMLDPQNQTALQSKTAEQNDKASRFIGETSPSSVNNQ